MARGKARIIGLMALALLLGLPALGVVLAGRPLFRYMEFPPVSRFIRHAPFSWAAFMLYFLFIAIVTGPLLVRALSAAVPQACEPRGSRRTPWWGWAGLGAGLLSWVLAWTRFSWFSSLQPHTFLPLWLSYILVVNSLGTRFNGSSLLTSRPGYFLALFPASACFWWFFEYLNRFVQNWYYTGVRYSPAEYALYASLSFATVLPAVLSTRHVLERNPRLKACFSSYVGIRFRRPKMAAAFTLASAAAGLFWIGIFPDYLFPLLWISPLLILVSIQTLWGLPHVLSPVAQKNWQPVICAALAAVICGVFWEMWNYESLARWEYQVPFVNRFHVFEMPILGWAGYLPFGLECAAAGQLLEDLFERKPPAASGDATGRSRPVPGITVCE